MAVRFIRRSPGGPAASTGNQAGIGVDSNDNLLKVMLAGTQRTVVTTNIPYVGDDVTLAGSLTYLTIVGQVITRNAINLATDVVGLLPATSGAASATAAYAKTTAGAQTLLASAVIARRVIISVQVTEVFANGSGAQTVFIIGETGSTSKFAASTLFTGAALGTTFSFGGTLTSGTNLLVTGTAATGNGTGALAVTVIAVP
jgi:hypothetical protein